MPPTTCRHFWRPEVNRALPLIADGPGKRRGQADFVIRSTPWPIPKTAYFYLSPRRPTELQDCPPSRSGPCPFRLCAYLFVLCFAWFMRSLSLRGFSCSQHMSCADRRQARECPCRHRRVWPQGQIHPKPTQGPNDASNCVRSAVQCRTFNITDDAQAAPIAQNNFHRSSVGKSRTRSAPGHGGA